MQPVLSHLGPVEPDPTYYLSQLAAMNALALRGPNGGTGPSIWPGDESNAFQSIGRHVDLPPSATVRPACASLGRHPSVAAKNLAHPAILITTRSHYIWRVLTEGGVCEQEDRTKIRFFFPFPGGTHDRGHEMTERTRNRRWPGSLGAILLAMTAGCEGSLTTPASPSEQGEGVGSSHPIALETHGSRIYFCTTSRLTGRRGGDRYAYGLIRIPVSPAELEVGEKRLRFKTFVTGDEGQVEWAVWCDIPWSQQVLRRTIVRLGLTRHVESAPEGLALPVAGPTGFSSLMKEPDPCPWEGAYLDQETQTCVVPLDPIGTGPVDGGDDGGQSSAPPPPDDDEDYNPPDPTDGGGSPPPPPDYQDADPCETSNSTVNAMGDHSIFYVAWNASNPNAPLLDRREIGGWIVRTSDGRLEFDPWPYRSSVCGIDVPEGKMPPLPGYGTIVGTLHTHPYGYGDFIPNCDANAQPMGTSQRYLGMASDHDHETAAALGQIIPHPDHPNPLPGYIVDEDAVITYAELGSTGMRSNRISRCGY